MDAKQEVVNLDDLSMDEIKELAEQEMAGQQVQPEAGEAEQPRDEKGRFTKNESEPEPTVFKREIDLGDGSGVQVFEAESLEQLVDKLAEAQRNATKKIREQAEQLRKADEAKQEAAKQQAQLSEDDEFILSQELMSHPSQAIKKAFKQMTGYDITEFKTVAERVDAYEQAQQRDAQQQRWLKAQDAFVAAHPEYVPDGGNGKRLAKAVELMAADAGNQGQELDFSALLEKAYDDLRESGLLKLKDSEDVTAEKEPTGAGERRIAEPEEVVPPQRKKASSLSTRGRVTTPVKNAPSMDELYDMPLEQLQQLADKELAQKQRME